MEDQPADSGDLTSDAAVPQGKAARRHRLPRQKLAPQTPESDADAETDVEPTDTEPADPDEVAPEAVEPEAVKPVAPRRRRPFGRRRATPDAIPADGDVTESSDETTELESESDGEPEPEPILVPHRTAGRGLKVAAVAAGVLFVAAAAFAGATLQPYLADRAEVRTKFEVAQTAANAITTLWTYTPQDMDTLPDRADRYLGGDFAADYRRYIDSIVEPNKQAQVSNDTQVLGAAVESLTATEATALVYTNSVATSPVTKGIPSLRYLSYLLSLERRGNEWLITSMTAVTSLDLTPRL